MARQLKIFMAESFYFDTNLLIRWIVWDDEAQATKVQSLIDRLPTKKILIADIVIAEIVWVLKSVYKLEKNDIAQAVDLIISNPKFSLNQKLFDLILDPWKDQNSISFADFMIWGYAQLENSSTLYTFDQKLAKNLENTILL